MLLLCCIMLSVLGLFIAFSMSPDCEIVTVTGVMLCDLCVTSCHTFVLSQKKKVLETLTDNKIK